MKRLKNVREVILMDKETREEFDKIVADPAFDYSKQLSTQQKKSIYAKNFNMKQSIIIMGSIVGIFGFAIVYVMTQVIK